MRRLAPALLLACTAELDPDAVCREVAYAIAARTAECTGDEALAESRAAALDEAWVCLERAPEAMDDTSAPIAPQNLFHCPYAIRALDCDQVEAFGDDLGLWLESSPICAYVLAPAVTP